MATDERIVEAIERLMVESVGVTTVALGQASPDCRAVVSAVAGLGRDRRN